MSIKAYGVEVESWNAGGYGHDFKTVWFTDKSKAEALGAKFHNTSLSEIEIEADLPETVSMHTGFWAHVTGEKRTLPPSYSVEELLVDEHCPKPDTVVINGMKNPSERGAVTRTYKDGEFQLPPTTQSRGGYYNILAYSTNEQMMLNAVAEFIEAVKKDEEGL